MSKAEVACFFSHRLAWTEIVRLQQPCLILEDDAVLSVKVRSFIDVLSKRTGLDHVSLETRGRKKILGEKNGRYFGVDLRRLYLDKSGAAAYILWPKAASDLLLQMDGRVALADSALCLAGFVHSYQADPALAVQADQCGFYGLSMPIDPASIIGHSNKIKRTPATDWLNFCRCKTRRLLSQIKQAWCHRFVLFRGCRRVVELDFSDKRH